MASYAILGATGNTGLSLLEQLGKSSNNTIHALVRSRSKLERLYPINDSNANLKVFEGNIADVDTVAQCLAGTKAAFLAVAVNDNVPGCSIAYDTANSVVAALKSLRSDDAAFKPPRLIVLSSATMDDKFWSGVASFFHPILRYALSHVYDDLSRAEKFLREQEDWLSCTFVMPGGLVHDVQKGHELSTTRQQTFVSFLDLAAAMIEVADEESEKWDMQNVSVVLKDGQKAKIVWGVPFFMVLGLLCTWFPGLYPYLKSS